MKELVKATKLHKKINKIDNQIIDLKHIIENVLKEDLKVKTKFRIKTSSEDILKKQITMNIDLGQSIQHIGMPRFLQTEPYKSNDHYDFNKNLESCEFVFMCNALLQFKKEKRAKLVMQYNSLYLKLKEIK